MGASKELREKYRNNPAFMIEEDEAAGPNKRPKTTAEDKVENVFELPPIDER